MTPRTRGGGVGNVGIGAGFTAQMFGLAFVAGVATADGTAGIGVGTAETCGVLPGI